MIEYLLNTRYGLVNFVDSIFGLGLEMAVWIIIILFAVIVSLVILILIFKKIFKSIFSRKEKLIYEYDNIFYLLAKGQYTKEINKKSIGGDPCIAAIKPILNLKNPSYIANRVLIKENIKKVELLLGEQIIGDDIWKKINIFHKKLKSVSLWSKIVKIFVILIVLAVVAMFVSAV